VRKLSFICKPRVVLAYVSISAVDMNEAPVVEKT